jgi:hypothetical protein
MLKKNVANPDPAFILFHLPDPIAKIMKILSCYKFRKNYYIRTLMRAITETPLPLPLGWNPGPRLKIHQIQNEIIPDPQN